MFNPTFETDDLQNTIRIVQPTEKPGVEGMKPAMLISCMFIGSGMWMGIFYVGRFFLQAITG